MKKFCAIMLLSVIAFANATYLTSKAYGRLSWPSICDINSKLSCDIAMSHPAAYIWPIVFPAIAMVVYPVLFLIAWFGKKAQKDGKDGQKFYQILTYLSWAGILFNSYFIYQETFTIGAFCPLCLLCTAIIISIFVISLLGWKKWKPPVIVHA